MERKLSYSCGECQKSYKMRAALAYHADANAHLHWSAQCTCASVSLVRTSFRVMNAVEPAALRGILNGTFGSAIWQKNVEAGYFSRLFVFLLLKAVSTLVIFGEPYFYLENIKDKKKEIKVLNTEYIPSHLSFCAVLGFLSYSSED